MLEASPINGKEKAYMLTRTVSLQFDDVVISVRIITLDVVLKICTIANKAPRKKSDNRTGPV